MNTREARTRSETSIDKARHSAAADQAKGKTKQFVGKVKERVGNAVGDDELAARGTAQRADGKADEVKGKVKEKIDDARDAVKGATEAIKDKLDDARRH